MWERRPRRDRLLPEHRSGCGAEAAPTLGLPRETTVNTSSRHLIGCSRSLSTTGCRSLRSDAGRSLGDLAAGLDLGDGAHPEVFRFQRVVYSFAEIVQSL